ncbi:hypothetical protein LTR69_011504 [Exophiala sideris]|uniref:Zn(2)-C6 fungal-type domain-containing protein n=1 Tax=Exophiala sideris TaxID=1016849 RepID=A0ABR0IUH0_9EURO|nr:hypothetical protein LTR69_011504 [Exophiala sideris]
MTSTQSSVIKNVLLPLPSHHDLDSSPSLPTLPVMSQTVVVEPENNVATGQKRRRYVSRACGECKKRKIRCGGEQPCEQCTSGKLRCEYTTDSRRRRNPSAADESPDEQVQIPGQQEVDNSRVAAMELVSQLRATLGELQALKSSVTASSARETLTSIPSGLEDLIVNDHLEPGPGQTSDRNVFTGGPEILKPFDVLEKRVGNSVSDAGGDRSATSPASAKQDCLLSVCSDNSECYLRELRLWDASSAQQGMQARKEAVDVYFSLLNPHYFDRYTTNRSLRSITLERIQLIILVYLVVAVVKIVQDFCPQDNVIPGWYEFIRAEHLLNHIIRTGKGNLVTLQCLILKSSYLLYIERHDWAYDVMGTSVRLCFQLGIHNQQSWTGMTDFDVHMRIRIFWCIYCLERNIAHQCGAPYQINEKDIAIDLPAELQSGLRGLVSIEGSLTPIPNQLATIKWARLCSDMWDAMFGVNARQVNTEFVVVTDARILLLLNEVPPALRWTSATLKAIDGTIAALTAVILANKVDRASFQVASNALRKAVELLEDIAPGFSLARRLLRRLQNVIRATTQTMTTNQDNGAKLPPSRVDSASRQDPPTNYNHALFDFDLEDLVHFENFPMMEEDSNLFLSNSTSLSMMPYNPEEQNLATAQR